MTRAGNLPPVASERRAKSKRENLRQRAKKKTPGRRRRRRYIEQDVCDKRARVSKLAIESANNGEHRRRRCWLVFEMKNKEPRTIE